MGGLTLPTSSARQKLRVARDSRWKSGCEQWRNTQHITTICRLVWRPSPTAASATRIAPLSGWTKQLSNATGAFPFSSATTFGIRSERTRDLRTCCAVLGFHLNPDELALISET